MRWTLTASVRDQENFDGVAGGGRSLQSDGHGYTGVVLDGSATGTDFEPITDGDHAAGLDDAP